MAIRKSAGNPVDSAAIKIVEVDASLAARLAAADRPVPFSELFGDSPAVGTMVGQGDQLSVQIWEAPPAVLFGSSSRVGVSSATTMPSASTTTLNLQALLVDADGSIPIPFAGNVRAAGRTPAEIARDIRSRLAGKAHDPQVVVSLTQNSNSTVSVVGDVKSNARVALSPYGERILEVLAGAGGVNDRVDRTMIQLSRDGRMGALPLGRIIESPAENIRLRPNDVVTALAKTLSFTSLGASGVNSEVEFEATGITLSQALGRIGGLKDDRANVRGVFIFRYEKPELVGVVPGDGTRLTSAGRVPVIYRVDMSRPETLFLAQNLPVRNKDVLYVTSAPVSDLQRFVQIASSMAFTVIGLGQAVP